MTSHSTEVERGERFQFGANWQRFLNTLNEERIAEAERSLLRLLELESLQGLRFLDIGCGSGLFSLAARRLGATVHSFDYDPQSVACTRELKRRYFPDDSAWTIEEGSVLDREYLQGLGQFDIVYSWGVLHHTGQMAQALENAAIPVADNGRLYIAIYNDQGLMSRFWRRVKKTYCANRLGRLLVSGIFIPLFAIRAVGVGLVKYGNPFGEYAQYKKKRGMSIFYDWIDWLGGYPFEVAKPEEILRVYRSLGFELTNMKTTNRLGCNEFVFRKVT
ncbi:MAG: class I SAM-dependent methyltransferase [Planctomycetes bacterium]|nr:class I SAM-dependent methyltransferase [Planctomycetota bacterium]